MFGKIRGLFNIKSLSEKLDELKEIEKSLDENRSLLDNLSNDYVFETNRYNSRFNCDSPTAIKRIEENYSDFMKSYDSNLSESIKVKFKLEGDQDKLLKDSKVDKIIKSIGEEKDSLNEIKKAVKDRFINVDEYLEVVKEKQGGKVKYADNIVINEEGKILLLKRSMWEDQFQGAWVIPGGHVDPGEDFETAAVRELKEESGLTSTNAFLDGTYEDNNCIIHYYRSHVNTKEQPLLLDFKETVDYVWVTFDEIDDYTMVFNMKDNIKEILDINDKYRYITNIRKAIEDGVLDENEVLEKAKESDKKKVAQVMGEFKEGSLKTSGGEKVTDRNQAVAIALSEAELSKSIDYKKGLEQMAMRKKDPVFFAEAYHNWNDQGSEEGKYTKHTYSSVLEFFQNNYEDLSKDEELIDATMKELTPPHFNKSLETLEKALNDGLIDKDSFEKARAGIYKDNGKNRKKGCVGATYGQIKKEIGDLPKGRHKEIINEVTDKIGRAVQGTHQVCLVNKSRLSNTYYFFLDTSIKGQKKFNVRISDHPLNPKITLLDHSTLIDVKYGGSSEDIARKIAKKADLPYNFKKGSPIREFTKGNKIYYSEGKAFKCSKISDIDFKEDSFTLEDGKKIDYYPESFTKVDGPDDEIQQKLVEEQNDLIKEFKNSDKISSPFTDDDNLEKARTGTYADTAQNRRLKRVGKKYGSTAKKDEPSNGKQPKKEGTSTEKQSTDLSEQAKQVSGSALEQAAKEATDPDIRVAANNEIDRRGKEESVQQEEVKEPAEEKPTEEVSEDTQESLMAELKRLRDEDIDYSDSKAMDDNMNAINAVRQKLQDLAEGKKSETKDKFEKYTKGYLDLSKESTLSVKLSKAYKKDQKKVEKYLNKEEDIETSLDIYEKEGYTDIRSYLSNPEKYIEEEGEPLVADLNQLSNDVSKFIQDNKIDKAVVLNRNVKGPGLEFFKNLKKGDVYEDKSFSSTSLTPLSIFGDFNISILADKGANVANANNKAEFEYLIDKNSKFEVIDSSENGIIVKLI